MCRVVNDRYKNDPLFKKRRMQLFKETGLKMRERYKKEGLPKAWMEWYKKFSAFGKSKIEDKAVEFIKPKVSNLERSYLISNMFVDIYIPEKNLVVECLGDYWHMTPKKYLPTDYNKSTKRTAQEQWDKDKRRRLFVESRGYNVEARVGLIMSGRRAVATVPFSSLRRISAGTV